MDVFQYTDMMAEKHKAVWDALEIAYSDFIRTTEEKHKLFVQEVLQKCYEK
jgi:methionyl-tRNA synthetase